MKRAILAVLCVACALGAPRTGSAGERLKWGAYTSGSLEKLEKKVRHPVDMQAVFVGWDTDAVADVPTTFPTDLKGTGKTLVIFWESSVDRPYDRLSAGDWDAPISEFARNARDYADPVVFIPFSEMNGDWETWAGTADGNSPEKFVAAWRHLRGLFAGAPNVLFGWDPNAASFPDREGNRIEDYYPGDDVVDLVGVDGFNFGRPWQTFADVFDDALSRVSAYPKPLYVFSTASTEGPRKAEWIDEAFAAMRSRGVAGFVWFNTNKERDWRIWSDRKALEAFRRGLDGE